MDDDRLLDALTNIRTQLNSIEAQVRLTNGRVTSNEKAILVLQTQWSLVLAFAGMVATAVSGFIAWVSGWFQK